MTVHGTTSVRPLQHVVIADRIEAETFAAAAAVTGGDVHVTAVRPRAHGCRLEALEHAAAASKPATARPRRGPKRLDALDVVTREYPGFPTDMQAQIIAVLRAARASAR